MISGFIIRGPASFFGCDRNRGTASLLQKKKKNSDNLKEAAFVNKKKGC
jgi:hypothetical protein